MLIETVHHDFIAGYVVNEHIDWTDATQNLRTDGSGCFVGAEEIIDYSFDDADAWSFAAPWSVSGGQASITATGNEQTLQPDPSVPIIAGRRYSAKIIISSLTTGTTGNLRLRVGGTSLGQFKSPGTYFVNEVAGSTTNPQLQATRALDSCSAVIDSLEIRLMPDNTSMVGDLRIWNDLEVGGDVDMAGADVVIKTLTINQPDASNISASCLEVNCGSSTSAPSGQGGGVTIVTGDGSIPIVGSYGPGGDMDITLGNRGGVTALYGRFLISDHSANSLMTIGKDEISFNDDSQDIDFRVETNGDANALVVNAGANRVQFGVDIELGEGDNIIFGTSTGGRVGLNSSNKLSFWGVTPIVQQVLATGGGATVDNVITALQNMGLVRQSA